MPFPLFSEVILTEDLPEQGLHKGQVGVMVEHYPMPEGEDGYSIEGLVENDTVEVLESSIEPRVSIINKNINNSDHEFFFRDHLLKKRLNRVSSEQILKFLEELGIERRFNSEVHSKKSKKDNIELLIKEYKLKRRNHDFDNKFKAFLQDIVLAAKEANYLIFVEDT